MPKESTSPLQALPFKQNPRDGQRRIFDKIAKDPTLRRLNIQLPTGYGKSFTSAGVYSILKNQNRVNRLLMVFPTVAQLRQFEKDGPNDLKNAGVDGPLAVNDLGLIGVQCIKRHRKNTAQIFCVTIQALSSGQRDNVLALMETGSWMVTADEYHHYGDGKCWAEAIAGLNYWFLLAMSATPYRPGNDSAFGAPDIVVSYRDAVDEKAVKPLEGHSYIYQVDAILENGDVCSYTTDELVESAGTQSPDGIEKHRIESKMRWSPKYISPLVSHPIERLIENRIRTGHKLQAIIGAMCVSHAELVCDQVRAMFPEYSVDWVGTGPFGKSEEENQKILSRFCPPKDERGERNPSLDILVHVGMAGEGLDSVHVSEVIHLNKASKNNSNDQENGRAARYLDGVIGYINFDSSSEYARLGYVGDAIMDAMDNIAPAETPEDKEPQDREFEFDPLPDEPEIRIWKMELMNIDKGCPEVRRMAEALATDVIPNNYGLEKFKEDLDDPNSQLYDIAFKVYSAMRAKEAEQFNERSILEQWQNQVTNALNVVTHRVIKTISPVRIEKSLSGDIKKRINGRKKRALGEIKKDVETYRLHYQWLQNLDSEIVFNRKIPTWLE